MRLEEDDDLLGISADGLILVKKIKGGSASKYTDFFFSLKYFGEFPSLIVAS